MVRSQESVAEPYRTPALVPAVEFGTALLDPGKRELEVVTAGLGRVA